MAAVRVIMEVVGAVAVTTMVEAAVVEVMVVVVAVMAAVVGITAVVVGIMEVAVVAAAAVATEVVSLLSFAPPPLIVCLL